MATATSLYLIGFSAHFHLSMTISAKYLALIQMTAENHVTVV